MRIHLPEDEFVLTAALPAHTDVLHFIDLEKTVDYLDFINLKAYDFFGAWSAATGHHAQLYAMRPEEPSGASGVGYVMSRNVPPKKILFGIPAYGVSFPGSTGPGQPFTGGADAYALFEYNQLPRQGSQEIVDRRHIAARCVGADGGFVTYDNPETVSAKADFCKRKGLGVRIAMGGPLGQGQRR